VTSGDPAMSTCFVVLVLMNFNQNFQHSNIFQVQMELG
jgi:hypothetical protein